MMKTLTKLYEADKKPEIKLTASTKEKMIEMLNKFYYSTTFQVDFETGEVSNSKGVLQNKKVLPHRGGWKFVWL